MKRIKYPHIPENLEPPFSFREPGGQFEGKLDNPWEIINMFEPVDVLNGATEVVDSKGNIICICTNNQKMIEENEYTSLEDLFLEV